MLRMADTHHIAQHRQSVPSNAALPKYRGKPVYAALDLGTNNCRLLVAQQEGAGFRVLEAFSREVCLGEGIIKNQHLSDKAVYRALKAIDLCAKRIQILGCTHLRAVATEACRQASNRNEFISKVLTRSGVSLDIISPQEEARLAVTGCAPLVDPNAEELLVFDIGGGSTEIAYVNLRGQSTYRKRLLLQNSSGFLNQQMQSLSLPVGVATLQDKFSYIEDTQQRYQAMYQHTQMYLKSKLENQTHGLQLQGNTQMLGASGTITTLTGLHLGLKKYDRSLVDGSWIELDEIQKIIRHLVTLNTAERQTLPCVGTGHFGLLLAGSAILNAITNYWPIPRIRVADRGLREGIIYNLIATRHRNPSRFRTAAV